MPKPPKNISSDLKGINKITEDAINGVTNIVESLHATIASFTPIVGNPKSKTKGLSSLIYGSIRKITNVFTQNIDIVLGKLSPVIGEQKSPKVREAIISVCNGIIGDYLAEQNNPLAINMGFRKNGQLLSNNEVKDILNNSNGKILILIHGLCMNDLHWQRQNHNHGEALAKDLGFITLYLHYNSGKHVSENGKQLSELLQQLFDNKNQITFLTHSMGGLVARSACYYAEKNKQQWLQQLNSMIFLGTPHHGALLEKTGNWLNILLKTSPYTAPFTKITNIRSCGITDLRYGNICAEDWQNQARFDEKISHIADKRQIIPLPKNVQCYAVASSSSKKDDSIIQDNIIGDGLVTINSALGIHSEKKRNLNFPKQNIWIGRNINHNQLLSSTQVYKTLQKWLKN